MKSNKGFTLIELLAVIVILAVIALIATPMILGVVETARKGAAESSVLGFVDAVEKQIMINEVDADKTAIADDTYEVTEGTAEMTPVNGTAEDAIDIDVKGEVPGATSMVISKGEVQTTNFTLGKYYVTYNKSTGKATASTTAPTGE